MSISNLKGMSILGSSATEVKKAVDDPMENSKAEVHDQQIHASTKALVDDDFSPLLGEPFFNCVLTKSNVYPFYRMVFPVKLHHNLPFKTVPAVIVCRGRTWEATVCVDNKLKKLNVGKWKIFVDDNELKIGDALFWEILEKDDEKVKFKVQIIRGDIPAELEAKINGETAETPIVID